MLVEERSSTSIRGAKRIGCIYTERISLPDIPTAKELGYDIVTASRYAIYGPPGMPRILLRNLKRPSKRRWTVRISKR
jgi:tripartite-type tricarboxylate transporter receptor subunit TctC